MKLVSIVIDGDDPIRNNFNFNSQYNNYISSNNSSIASTEHSDDDEEHENQHQPQLHICTAQCNDILDDVEVIPLPVNGLLDRLNEFSRRGVIIDSRVYSFAIGLKQGEKLAQSLVKPENIEVAI